MIWSFLYSSTFASCDSSPSGKRLPEPHFSLDRLNQLRRIESHALLEHHLDVPDIADVRRRIAGEDHEVRLFADGNRTDLGLSSQISGAVQSANGDRFERSKSRFEQQFELSLVGV